MQIAEVSLSETWCPRSAVLSPLSEDAAVLTVLGPEKTADIQGCSLEGAVVEDSSQNCATHLPEIVNSVLSKIDISVEDSLASLGRCQEIQNLPSFDYLQICSGKYLKLMIFSLRSLFFGTCSLCYLLPRPCDVMQKEICLGVAFCFIGRMLVSISLQIKHSYMCLWACF